MKEENKTTKRPGVMIYFDVINPLKRLSDKDRGKLFLAILEYAKDGTIPDFSGMLALTFEFVLPKIDRDEKAYENVLRQRQYASFCRQCNALNLPKVSFDEWQSMTPEERKRSLSANNELRRKKAPEDSRYPTTDTTTDTAIPTAISTAAAADTATNEVATGTSTWDNPPLHEIEATATAEDDKLAYMGGVLGQGVVLLSGHQVDDLLNQLGQDAFDHYTKRLSDFIIKNNASVPNHHATILKWYREDTKVVHTRATKQVPKENLSAQEEMRWYIQSFMADEVNDTGLVEEKPDFDYQTDQTGGDCIDD